MNKYLYIPLILSFLSSSGRLAAWDDYTHIAIGDAAGFKESYSMPAPEIARIKAFTVESYNHFCYMPRTESVTPELIKSQIPRYNAGKSSEKKGHLYGAIVASVRACIKKEKSRKSFIYNLAYTGYYISELSMPLQNIEYGPFNKKHHEFNDGIIENEIRANMGRIKTEAMKIDSEDSLIGSIAAIANKSKDLGYRLEKENRDMTRDEAYTQVSQSASLFKAVLEYVGYFEKK